MQVRAMKGVRAVLDPAPDSAESGRVEPGVWIPLSALLELPVTGPVRSELLQWVLAQLEGQAASRPGSVVIDDCRAVLLAALEELDLTHARQCLETGAWQEGRRAWEAALQHHRQLLNLRPGAVGEGPLRDALIQCLARLDQTLTHRQWCAPRSPLENAQVHADAAALLMQIRNLGQALPGWFEVVEEGLLRRGALALLQQSSATLRREGVVLLLRHASLHPPVQEWTAMQLDLALLGLLEDLEQSSDPLIDLQALLECLASLDTLVIDEPSRQAAAASALTMALGCLALAAEARQPGGLRDLDAAGRSTPVRPEQIAALVEDWLVDQPTSLARLTAELVWIPGARVVPHGPGQLALNLAAVPAEIHRHPDQLASLFAAVLDPLQRSRWRDSVQLRCASSSLLASLGQFWSGGGALNWEECQLLAQAQVHWPSKTAADFADALLAPGCCVVQPSLIQLAALRCWLLEQPHLMPALADIRRHHHDAAFMQREAAAATADGGDVLPILCALHSEEGFYGASSAPLASLELWATTCLGQLAQAQWLVDPQGWSGSMWAVLQGVIQHHNHLPQCVLWPQEERFYQLLAGQEVVLISPLAALVDEQHSSGRAFALFRDLEIAPYGLRTLNPPASRYPARPDRSFEASLSACLDAVHRLFQARPFTVFLSVAGAYDLPLCHAVHERYGVSCLAIGEGLHARFGIEQSCSAGWRAEQRRADRWRRIC